MSRDGDETLPTSGAPRPTPPARLVAGRYRFQKILGIGGHGHVWQARDEVTGSTVALKLLQKVGADEAAWTRREIAALRMLRIPGVVRLLDEGLDDGETFFVMELVEGTPFPGKPGHHGWADIEAPTLALLETLARLHAEGVVHRDLKPDNILVDPSGRLTILDFGIATSTFVPDRLTQHGLNVGTPAYLAPEQIRGERATAATDLYALGVILFHALTGKLPHEAPTVQQILTARLTTPAPPIGSLAPGIPAHAAETIDWLLSKEPDDRPAGAAAVLGALRRTPGAAAELPWAGDAALVQRIVDQLERGRRFRLVGGPGMGKTRTACEVGRALAARGREFVWIRPGERPYASLAPVAGNLEQLRALPVERVDEEVRASVVRAITRGTLLLVDDADRLDRASKRLLATFGPRLPALLVFSMASTDRRSPDGVLAPLDELAAERLFAGSNRLFHVREDAARELVRRTNGVPARIEVELRAWVRAGLARRLEDGRHALDRGTVARLTTDLVPLPTDVLRPRRDRRLAEGHDELLAWIELADGAATGPLLAVVTGRAPWEIEADVAELVDTGACGRVPPDSLVALEGSRRLADWSWTERTAAHARLAAVMPSGVPGRLRHLVLARAEDRLDVVRESLDLAERFAVQGALGRAAVALEEGLAVARSMIPAPEEEIAAIARLWVATALYDGSTRAIDRVLYELGRLSGVPELEAMTALARAALAVRAASTGGAALAESVPPFSNRRLERLRLSTRMLAARRRDLGEEERVLADIEHDAGSQTLDAHARATLADARGKVFYRKGRYAEAFEAQLEAARFAEWPIERIAANLQAVTCAIELFDLDVALETATEARREAAAARHPYLEGRAEYLLRVARYRLEEPLEPDLELVDLLSTVASDLEALCALQEAAFAFRNENLGLAAELALRAVVIWERGGEAPGRVLAEALWLACTPTPDATRVSKLVERLRARNPSRVIAQSTALLGKAGLITVDAPVGAVLVATVPEEHRGRRLAVLTMEEVAQTLLPGTAGTRTC